MACCGRLAPALLIHVNLLLCMVAGAALATAARLKWDPSTYVAVRELFPHEYRAAASVLCAAGVAMLVLAHVAAVALAISSSHPRCARALLIAYAVVMTSLALVETAWAAWLGVRLEAWFREQQAAHLLDLLELREFLRPFLVFLARYHPLPDHIKDLMEEAEADAPRNLYVASAAVVLTTLLQPAAALLALLCAAGTRLRRGLLPSSDSISFSITSTENENAPLKTAYRNGRLVIL